MIENSDNPVAAGIEVHSGVVHPWHLDRFGHMNVRWYSHLLDDASFLFWQRVGFPQEKMVKELETHTVTASARTDFLNELAAGECVNISARVKRLGTKSLTLQFELLSLRTGIPHARYETVEVFVNARTKSTVPIPEVVRRNVAGLPEATAALEQ